MTTHSPDVHRADPNSTHVAEAVRAACLHVAQHAYEDAKMSGLCEEGAWEAAAGAMRSIDLSEVIRRAISKDRSDL